MFYVTNPELYEYLNYEILKWVLVHYEICTN